MKKKRQYSLPFNGSNPQWYLNEVLKRKDYVDHVFCEFPYEEMLSHTRFQFNGADNSKVSIADSNVNRATYIGSCIEFLKSSKGKVRRICPLNAMYYKFDSFDDLKKFVTNVVRIVLAYKIDGLIISDFRIALMVHAILPDLEIHTSCNGYQWNVRQMEIWRKQCGVTVFNPPREILRKPSVLKEMHDAGFKLKCIINEGCLMGCPNTFCHQLSISLKCFAGATSCTQLGIGDFFKSNWILPRWQKYYDKYVDIYKIAGRNSEPYYPFYVLDTFINESDDFCLTDVMMSGTIINACKFLPDNVRKKITSKIVPDKLMTCECKDCNSCHLCEKILGSVIPNEYHKYFTYSVIVKK